MKREDLYRWWQGRLSTDLVLSPDLPEETLETTLAALWHAAAGKPCAAVRATNTPLEELDDEHAAVLEQMIGRRLAGTPLMQITGRAEFMGLELLFEPGVCLVRAETEILGNRAVELLSDWPERDRGPVLIDVGCGSGNLSCGIARRIPRLRVYAVDLLSSSVDLTRRNARHCGLDDRILVSQGDLFAPLAGLALEQAVDVIVCNPPYVASSRLKTDRRHLLDHEPREGCDGGAYGFAVHQRLIKEAPALLRPGGWLLFEMGAGQRRQVAALFERSKSFDRVELASDARGVERVAIGRRASQ